MKKLSSFFGPIAGLAYILLGFVQFAAIYSFFSEHWGWWFIFATPAAFIISYIPILGSVAGTIAANKVWDWSFFNAALLFFWPFVLFLPVILLGGLADTLKKISKR